MAQRYPDDAADTTAATEGPSRRRLLGWGLGLGAAALLTAAGCSVSDPRVGPPAAPGASGGPSASNGPPDPGEPTEPPPAPPEFAGAAAGAESERRLAGLAAATLNGAWRKELGDRAGLLAAVRDAHLAHATALQGDQPTTRPTTDPARPVAPAKPAASLEVALQRLVDGERREAARHRLSAVSTTGLATLLWASMSVGAARYANALESTKPVAHRKPRPPKPLPLLSDVEAMQQLVRQLHAINYGYPMAIGQLTAGPRRDAAVRRLQNLRALRDGLVSTLLTRRAEVPIAEPAYVPTVFPRTDATASRLVQDLEVRLTPFLGLWLAAGPTPVDRGRAFDALSLNVAAATSWGAPLRTWPGWS